MPSPLLSEHRNNPAVAAYRRLTGAQPHHRSANILERILEQERLQPGDAEFRILIMILAATDGARLDLEEAAQRVHDVNLLQQGLLAQNRHEYLTREIEIARDIKAHIAKNEELLRSIEAALKTGHRNLPVLIPALDRKMAARIDALRQIAYFSFAGQLVVIILAAMWLHVK